MEVQDSTSDAYFWGARRLYERTNVDTGALESAVYGHGVSLVASGPNLLF